MVGITTPASAASDPPVIDQGFAFATIEWSGVSETGGTPAPKSDWFLKASYRVWGSFADRSVLRYVVKFKGKQVGEVRCETRSLYNKVVKNGRPHIFATDCADRTLKFRDVGDYALEWHFIDGETDVDVTLGTETVVVREAPRYDLGATTRPWYPVIYPDRNSEIASTILYHRDDATISYLAPQASPSLRRGNGIDVVVQAAPPYSGDDPTNDSYIRCKVDGTPVDLKTPWKDGASSGTTSDAVWVSEDRGILAEAETPNPSGNPRLDTDPILFRTFYLQLPLTFAGSHPRHEATSVSDKPGAWECDWRNGKGQTLRTFRFTVGADGMVAPHEEQTAHGLSLAPGAVYLEAAVPADSPLDARTAPAMAVGGAFGGRGLKSASAQAVAKAIAAKGNPLPPKYQKMPATKAKGR